VCRDPPFLLRGAEADQDDGRRRAFELAEHRVVANVRPCTAVVVDPDAGARDMDAQRREAPPPSRGGAFRDVADAADERDRQVAFGGEPNHERADLDPRPTPDPPSREERLHQCDSGAIGECQVGRVQQLRVGGIVAGAKEDLRVRREDAPRPVAFEEADACPLELFARCDLVQAHAEDVAYHYGPGVPASVRASDA
jgi:hypothetical protein